MTSHDLASALRPRRRGVLYAIIGLGIVGLIGWGFWFSVELLAQAEANGAIGRDARAAAERVKDCTTPGGECYQEGQASTAKAISGINEGTLRIVTATVLCSAYDKAASEEDLLRCVRARLDLAPTDLPPVGKQ